MILFIIMLVGSAVEYPSNMMEMSQEDLMIYLRSMIWVQDELKIDRKTLMKMHMNCMKELNRKASPAYFDAVETIESKLRAAGNSATAAVRDLAREQHRDGELDIAGGSVLIGSAILSCIPGAGPVACAARTAGLVGRLAGYGISLAQAIKEFQKKLVNHDTVKPKLDEIKGIFESNEITKTRKEIHFLLTQMQLLHGALIQELELDVENYTTPKEDLTFMDVNGVLINMYEFSKNLLLFHKSLANGFQIKGGNLLQYSKCAAGLDTIIGILQIFGGAKLLEQAVQTDQNASNLKKEVDDAIDQIMAERLSWQDTMQKLNRDFYQFTMVARGLKPEFEFFKQVWLSRFDGKGIDLH